MYQALYRKWRPQTFDEISGQQHITKILKMQCEEHRIAHAYLFCGTRGTGKTSTAKILAKAVNCEHPVNGNPCNHCYACTSIDNGSATDVLEIDAASNNGVDDIRDLRDEVVYPPSMLKKRVYIIDEVHMLSSGAFNALLKTLEEPPQYIVFILATTELNKLPATIISRCIRFDFNRLSEETIAERIRYVAQQEKLPLGEGAAELLARLADGALRDGLSILEACTSGVGAGHEITAQDVGERLGIADADQLLTFYRAIAKKRIPEALSVLEEIHRSSKDIGIFLDDLSSMARDLLVLQQLRDRHSSYDGAIRFRTEALSLLNDYPDSFSAETLFYLCSVLEDTQGRMARYATNKKMLLEFAAIRLCDPALSESPKALLARIAKLEKLLTSGTVAVAAPPSECKAAAKEPDPPKAPSTKICRQNFSKYAELAEEMMGHPDLLPYIQKIEAIIEEDSFIITADSFTIRMLQLGNNAQAVAAAVQAVTGRSYKLVFRERGQEQTEHLIDEL